LKIELPSIHHQTEIEGGWLQGQMVQPGVITKQQRSLEGNIHTFVFPHFGWKWLYLLDELAKFMFFFMHLLEYIIKFWKCRQKQHLQEVKSQLLQANWWLQEGNQEKF
jgi:hypothetical protein